MMRAIHTMCFVILLGACGDEAVDRDTTPTPSDTSADTVDASDTTTAAPDTLDGATDTTADVFVPVDTNEPLGADRPATVVLPSDYDPSRAWPLVLLLHGYGVDGAIQDAYLGFSTNAAAAGFVTIIPDGTINGAGQRFWNSSPGWCCDFAGSGVDDAGYLVGLVTEARRRWHIDPSKVFAFGHSNGGFMANALACRHADVFAAIGSLAGSLPADGADCAPSQPVSVLLVHGTLDATIVYPGNADYPGAEEVATRWASYDICASTPESGDARDYDNNVPGAETTPRTWSGCDDEDVQVSLWTMTGSGHIPIVGQPFIDDVLAWLTAHGR